LSALFTSVEKVAHGWGALGSLSEVIPRGCRQALVVTGSASARACGVTERCEEVLRARGIGCTFHGGVKPEPTVEFVDQARDAASSAGADCVAGIGGGSVLDVAKAAAGLANCSHKTVYYHDGEPPEAVGVPFVAVPTTSGTGSEATSNSVLTDPSKGVKKSIRHPSFIARGIVLDPELTVSCPPQVTAHSGLDAFVQAIESYASIHASALSQVLSRAGCRLIAGSLLAAWRNGADPQARTDMAYGSYMAGVALANARLGAVHGLAHPLGLRLGIPHGLVCAILLPHALRFNFVTARERYDGLREALGADVPDVAERLCRELEVPPGLASFGFDRGQFDAIVEEGLASGSMKANPRPMTRNDILALLDELASV